MLMLLNHLKGALPYAFPPSPNSLSKYSEDALPP
jgi:hypothetical protein